MNNTRLIKLFISCPGDIKDELNSVKLIIEEINKTSGKLSDYHLEFINWKYDTFGDIGLDGQDVINNQLEDHYDILIGLIWQKLGTPTSRDESGTAEEINRAVSNPQKEQLIFFKTSPPENLNEIDLNELQRVRDFKEKLKDKGVLYKEFNTISDFELLLRINLPNLIQEKITLINKLIEEKSNSNKYADIELLIKSVENNDEKLVDIDIYDLLTNTTTYFDNITISLSSMGMNLELITQEMNKSTNELKKINHIKDNRLRLEKSKPVILQLAKDLDSFNEKLNNDISVFAENLKIGIESYSKALLAAEYYAPEQISDLKINLTNFKNNMHVAVGECAKLLKVFIGWPPINVRFNQSKRNTEIVLKNLTKEMLNGLYIIDEFS